MYMHSSGLGPRLVSQINSLIVGGVGAEFHLSLIAGGANYLLELHTGETGLPSSPNERWGEIKFRWHSLIPNSPVASGFFQLCEQYTSSLLRHFLNICERKF